MAINLLSLPFLLVLPIIFIILNHIITSLSSKQCRLPPGPKPWPIIGNIPHVGKRLHISLTNMAKIHGPIISLRLGSQLVIVGSSPIVAAEILKNQDRLLSARFVSKTLPRKTHAVERKAIVWNPTCCDQWKSFRTLFRTDRLLSARFVSKTLPRKTHAVERKAIVWNPTCCDQWKSFRTLFRTELFSSKAVELQASLREKKLSELIQFLGTKQGQVVDVGEVVFATVFNTISNLLFSKDLISMEDQGSSELKSLLWRMMELGTTPNLADYYPILEEWDPQGLRRQMSKCLKEMFEVWEIYIKERRERHSHDASNKDFLDVFLSNGFDDDQINWLILELFSAGVDTITTTVEWAMAELLKNKEAMIKICQELDREINRNSIHESQVSQLPYLNACVKETLRLHPPAPFLIPRRALETCEVMNYTIPKGSEVLLNVWAIGRDPSVWKDPLSFKPERFLRSNLDLKGHDFEFLPFGSGRRICPGLPMAPRQLCLILASLIHCFDWSLPNGEDTAMLDMNDKFGITLQKEKPLLLIPKRKL